MIGGGGSNPLRPAPFRVQNAIGFPRASSRTCRVKKLKNGRGITRSFSSVRLVHREVQSTHLKLLERFLRRRFFKSLDSVLGRRLLAAPSPSGILWSALPAIYRSNRIAGLRVAWRLGRSRVHRGFSRLRSLDPSIPRPRGSRNSRSSKNLDAGEGKGSKSI
ncbi:hypothetical protein ES706_01579 [subsurface metagenome]